MRIRSWAAFFNRAALCYWDITWNQSTAKGSIYLGPTERGYLGVLQNYTTSFPAASMITPTVSDTTKVRAYALSSANTYGAYLHAYTKHATATTGITVTVNPQASGTATWTNPSTGAAIGTPVSVPAGSQTLTVPPFTTDIALKISSSGAAPTDTTPPIVGTFTASAVSQTQINLSYSVTDNVAVTGYDLDWSANGTTGWTALITNTLPASPFQHTGRTASTIYYYRFRARDAAGNVSAYSNANATTNTPPAPPILANLYSAPLTIRNEYHELEPDWDFVTDDHTYQDGGKSFSELSDVPLSGWRLVFKDLSKADADVYRDHFLFYRKSRPFAFLDKRGETFYDIYYKSISITHVEHRSWSNRVEVILVRYPSATNDPFLINPPGDVFLLNG